MAQQDHTDGVQPADDTVSRDTPDTEAAVPDPTTPLAETSVSPGAASVTVSGQGGPVGYAAEAAPASVIDKPASSPSRIFSALPPLVMDSVVQMAAEAAKAQATFSGTTSSIVRMAAEASRNAAHFNLPPLPPMTFPALYEATFLKALTDLTPWYKTSMAALGPILQESQQWRQLIESVSVSQQLLVNQQVGLLRDALQQHTAFLSTVMASAVQFSDITTIVAQSLGGFNWQQLFPNLKQLKKQYREGLLASFLYADLWPAPSMPTALLDKIAQLADGDDRRPVVLAVWNHYARHDHAALEQAIASWNDDPEYAARQQIFEDALWGHRARRYTLTIPTLLSQVEGIAGDFVRTSTQASPAPKLGKSGQVVRHAVQVAGNAGFTDPDEAELLHVVLVEAVIEHVQNVSFQNTDFAAQYAEIRERRTLNRHGTLHGIQINYPSAMNSLRCFLLLDALYALRKHARQVGAIAEGSGDGRTADECN